jgi:hypothetical protein
MNLPYLPYVRPHGVMLRNTLFLILIAVLKGKAIPLQALTGPEGSRRLRFPDFKTIGT